MLGTAAHLWNRNQHIRSVIKSIIDVEGGFVDNPDDPGGATRYGVTEDVARKYGYQRFSSCSRHVAFMLYRFSQGGA